MPHEEIYNTRDRSYSAWHRRASIYRYVGIERAQTLSMIDMDAALYVEYDNATKEPLALIEAAVDRGTLWKPATVTRNLARRANMFAIVLLYKLSATLRNPADPSWPDIESFRYKKIHCPNGQPADVIWINCTAEEWARILVQIRRTAARQIDEKLDREFAR